MFENLRRILTNRQSGIGGRMDIAVAVGVVLIIGGFLLPIPGWVLDFFMASNILLALVVVLIVLYTRRPLDFSIFPTLLLVSTVFGLVLNISSTRLILARGPAFDGQLVRAFASFVVGSSGTEGVVIGSIIFIIIIAVQFIVITKGATRVAEVAARFTLDALPGKQMAIDAAYSSGNLSEEEATQKKNELQAEVNFYGAMDGASKFVSGNVKVGILITFVNILGGLVVGLALQGQDFFQALGLYVSLTIGDGLVSQFPALLISVATGLIVTRAISDDTFAGDISRQFSAQVGVYWIAAVFLALLAFIPGFPTIILLLMSMGVALLAYRLGNLRLIKADQEIQQQEALQRQNEQDQLSKDVSPVVPLDVFSLELAYSLVPLVDRQRSSELLDKIVKIRREMALDLGFVMPKVRIVDNMRLDPHTYSFKIRGVEVGRGEVRPNHYLAINVRGVEGFPGEETRDPAFGLPALWIKEDQREEAEKKDFTVVDPPSIIITHLTEVIKANAYQLITRQDVQQMLDILKKDHSAVVEELLKNFGLGDVQKIFQNLLREQVSIRNLVVILESMADYASLTKDIAFLTEKVRQALGRQIVAPFLDKQKVLNCLTIDPLWEKRLVEARLDTGSHVVAALDTADLKRWVNAALNASYRAQQAGYYAVILSSEAARPLVRSSLERDLGEFAALSIAEVPSDTRVNVLEEIKIEE